MNWKALFAAILAYTAGMVNGKFDQVALSAVIMAVVGVLTQFCSERQDA